MRKLHLVGLTTDLDGLIFAARKGSKSGGFVVPLDSTLLDVIADAQRRRNGEASAATPAPDPPVRNRADSALTPREMQARLRAGRSIEEVAAEAGVDTEWVARFAVPILAEQAQVVDLARTIVYAKPRRGDSALPLGRSVAWNLADRGVTLPEDIFDAAWSAYQLHDSVWMVRFRYRSRGREQDAQWEIDVPAARLFARNRLASDLGFVEEGRRRRIEPEPAEADAEQEPAPAVTPGRPRARALPGRTATPVGSVPAALTRPSPPTRRSGGAGRTAPPAPPAPARSTVTSAPARSSAAKAPAVPAKTSARRPSRPAKAPSGPTARPAKTSRLPAKTSRPPAKAPAGPTAGPAKTSARGSSKTSARPATTATRSAKKATPRPRPVAKAVKAKRAATAKAPAPTRRPAGAENAPKTAPETAPKAAPAKAATAAGARRPSRPSTSAEAGPDRTAAGSRSAPAKTGAARVAAGREGASEVPAPEARAKPRPSPEAAAPRRQADPADTSAPQFSPRPLPADGPERSSAAIGPPTPARAVPPIAERMRRLNGDESPVRIAARQAGDPEAASPPAGPPQPLKEPRASRTRRRRLRSRSD